MSLEVVTSNVMKELQSLLTAQVSQIVPELFKQLSPMFVDLVKKEISEYLSNDSDIKDIVICIVKESAIRYKRKKILQQNVTMSRICESNRKICGLL